MRHLKNVLDIKNEKVNILMKEVKRLKKQITIISNFDNARSYSKLSEVDYDLLESMDKFLEMFFE